VQIKKTKRQKYSGQKTSISCLLRNSAVPYSDHPSPPVNPSCFFKIPRPRQFRITCIVAKNLDNGFQNVSVREAAGLDVALRETARNLNLQ
jgi:hypothetical protein